MRRLDNILVALDGSGPSERAMALAGELALKLDANVTVLHVISGIPHAVTELRENLVAPHLRAYADLEHRAVSDAMWALGEELTGEAARRLRERGIGAVGTALALGDATAEIVDYAARNDVNLIVLGRRGLSGFERIFLGSVAHKVVRLAPCACITVP
jgi:nucleotide-binding universal stress UspA family protein